MVATRIANRLPPETTPLAFEFHSPDLPVPQDVVKYTEDKLATRLAKFRKRLTGVVVHIRDENGPKGGVGMVCHMEVRLAALEPVNVEERDADLRECIDIAIDRLEAVVSRHVGRARSLPRHKGAKIVRKQKGDVD